jgi:hypothetical protein
VPTAVGVGYRIKDTSIALASNMPSSILRNTQAVAAATNRDQYELSVTGGKKGDWFENKDRQLFS